MKVKKAVIVAAGRGTRFLPASKSVPKEMLPLLDKPLIHYAVAEAVASGIKEVVIITATGKQAIENYFSPDANLEAFLEAKGQTELKEQMRQITQMADISFVYQAEQLGLGHAVLTARQAVGEESFAVILPDDIIISDAPALGQMLAVFEQHNASVLAVEKQNPADLTKYGVIKPEKINEGLSRVLGLVEKPSQQEAPSNLGIVGRYILTPQIFDAIAATLPDKGGEIQLTDALASLLGEQDIYALEFDGDRYDTGTPPGWVKAQAALALKDPSMGAEFGSYLRRLL